MKKMLFNNLLIRSFLATALLGIMALTSNAQMAANYGFMAQSSTFTPISGTFIPDIIDDDVSSGMLPIGFTFNFCGVNYNQFKVNSNGWLSFADCFPGPGEMRENETFNISLISPMLMPLWDDQSGLNFNTFFSGTASYTVTGTTPNQVLTIEWNDWTWFWINNDITMSYQIKLYETSNVIEFIYQQEAWPLLGSEGATIGIANSETDFLVLSDASTNPTPSSTTWHNLISSKPATGQLYRFTPPPPCAGTPNAGLATAANNTLACQGSTNLNLSGNTVATSLEYQWQSSTDGTNWTNLGSVQTITAIATGMITQTTQFRAIVTCTTTSQSDTSVPVTVTVGPPVAGTAVGSPQFTCTNGYSTVSLTGASGLGVSYVWQQSTDNVNFSTIPGQTNPYYIANNVTGPMYYRAILSCLIGGALDTSASGLVDTMPSIAPTVAVDTISINCGDGAMLDATPATGSVISWYDVPTGGSPIAIENTTWVWPTSTTTYYAENSQQFTDLNVGATLVEHSALTGFDFGGIALSQNYVYYTGGTGTGRFEKNSLSGTALPQRMGFFGDQTTGQLWQLSDGTSLGASLDNSFGTNVDRIYALDENLNTTGTVIMLSQSVYVNPWGTFIAPGAGYVIIYDPNFAQFSHIDLTTGNVTNLGFGWFNYTWNNSWATYGWASFDGTDYYITCVDWNSITKVNLTTLVATPLQSYNNIGLNWNGFMANIAYWPEANRMYMHFQGQTEFGGAMNWNTQWVGYIGVNTQSCPGNLRTPVVVDVLPLNPPITPTGTLDVCQTGSQTLSSLWGGMSYQWQLNGVDIPGATGSSYTANQAGSYTLFFTDWSGCTGTSDPTVINIIPAVVPSVSIVASPAGPICAGTSVTFTATPVNGGTPNYQWKKNGVNVGTNSPTYTTTTLANGDIITVVMTGVGVCLTTPTATSNGITMTVDPVVVPSVTVTPDLGTTACIDEPINFTATATNGGTNPTYQWQVNGSNVGTNSTLYTVTAGALNTGDNVSVIVTSDALCATPTTATHSVTMTITPLTTPAASITADQTSVCEGTPVTLTATDNAPGGSYQWLLNGNPVGTNSSTYLFTPAVGDVVGLQFTPPLAGCYDNITVNSNDVPLTVTPGLPTMATISSVSGTVEGSLVTVYANIFNFSLIYAIDWYINGVLYTTTNEPYMSYVKGAGVDDIYAIVSNTGTGCYLTATTNQVSINSWSTSVGSVAKTGDISVYPNPFSNKIAIKGLMDGDHVIMMNMLGQTIQEWKIEKAESEHMIIINDLASGSYLLNIRDKDGNFRDMQKLQRL